MATKKYNTQLVLDIANLNGNVEKITNIMIIAANRFGDIKGEVSSDKKYITILFNASEKPVQPCYNIASAHATMHN